jgi:DNA polymerase III alpha subunit
LKKDKLLRASNNHVHKFEKRLVYLNLNDDTGNVACQVGPETFEKYSSLIMNLKKQPVIIYGKVNKDGTKIFADMIECVYGENETKELRDIFIKENLLDVNQSYIVSSHPSVSKKGNSFYRLVLSNGISGMCFRFNQKLFPGQLVEYGFEDPFLNLKIVEEV